MQLVFATNNKNKVYEVSKLITGPIKLLRLADLHFFDELAETGTTLEANALQKARYIFEKYHCHCFADDTGLEIEALGGRPGVMSARYAGEEKNAGKNMDKVLEEMKGMSNRRAVFRTVIALVLGGTDYFFEGRVEGVIGEVKRGREGFGYDPIFIPDEGGGLTFAEMTVDEKNKISHRARAVQELVKFLNQRFA